MDGTHEIIFTHPKTQAGMGAYTSGKAKRPCINPDGSLSVLTGANSITWGYGLNTVTYPTYGGEVVQILSAYMEDLNIVGDVVNYEMMEDIYAWFVTYLNVATAGGYDEDVVTMSYPHRQWILQIRPKSLPGLKIGRDVVAPSWSMTAAIIEGDPDAERYTLSAAIEGLKEVNAGVGYVEDNPFSAPTKGQAYDTATATSNLKRASDWYSKIVSSYAGGNFDSFDPGAKPTP